MTTTEAYPRRRRWTSAFPVLLLVSVCLAFLVAEPMRVTSQSMSPSYERGDEVLIVKIGLRARALEHGDVVAFRAPGSGSLMIKRVAGVGGDQVGIEDGVLTLNGDPVSEAYLTQESVDGTYFGPVRVPPGRVFVLGDARAGSIDSRAFGAISRQAIVGRVLWKLW
ncbi:signal peptidase I [Phycicoccus sp. Root101]|uniref:signal peptidase I n=1 Tax=Phycicoccus sp. Root101 TaxID=1736421 RepID=UPI00070354BD|nr:signal peptidase I [Phycicoccus sp. Root101]KQU67393.1 hypothetical protein ASC58_12495 [Phycicoccus sp. Root101]